MKKISAFILTISFLISMSGCSDTQIEERNGLFYKLNETEPFTGTYNGSYPSGKMASEENYKDGKREGLRTDWFENGQKKEESNWKDGIQDGLTTLWYDDGKKKEESHLKDGKLDGLSTFWYETGQLNGKAIFKNGVLIKRL